MRLQEVLLVTIQFRNSGKQISFFKFKCFGKFKSCLKAEYFNFMTNQSVVSPSDVFWFFLKYNF